MPEVMMDMDTEEFEKERKEEEELMDTKVEIKGISVRLGDMFPHVFEAKEFMSRLNLIEAAKGGGDAGLE